MQVFINYLLLYILINTAGSQTLSNKIYINYTFYSNKVYNIHRSYTIELHTYTTSLVIKYFLRKMLILFIQFNI